MYVCSERESQVADTTRVSVRGFSLQLPVLTFEPSNTMITDYQATLAQYINNGKKLVQTEGLDAFRFFFEQNPILT